MDAKQSKSVQGASEAVLASLAKGTRRSPELRLQKEFSVCEAAAYLGVTENSIRLWKTQGRLKFVKAGRLLAFTKADLDSFLKRNGGVDPEIA